MFKLVKINEFKTALIALAIGISYSSFASLVSLNSFQIKIEDNQIKIWHQDDPKKIIWSNENETNFIQAGYQKQVFKEKFGRFQLKKKAFINECKKTKVLGYKSINNQLIISGKLEGRNCLLSFHLVFENSFKNRLSFNLSLFDKSSEYLGLAERINNLLFVYDSDKKEKFYGFGEQFTYFDLKGKIVPIISQEQGHGRGKQPITFIQNTFLGGLGGTPTTSYAPSPHYITNNLKSLYIKNYEYMEFDLKKNNHVRLNIFHNSLSGEILYGKNYLDLISTFTKIIGRMKALPEWFHQGAIVGLMGGSERVRKLKKKFEKYEVPISAYWLQDWVGQRKTLLGPRLIWDWQIDQNSYGDWDKLRKEIQNAGSQVLGYINPFLSRIPKNNKYFRKSYFQEALDNNYLILNKDGQPYKTSMGGFSGTLIDLTNAKAKEWLKDIIKKEMIGNGMKGWMADFGEALPFDIELSSGVSAKTYHNKYPEDWARLNLEAISELGLEDEIIFFNRAGYLNSPKYSRLFWLGDQLTSWDKFDGIKTAVTGLLSSGISGYSINHSDIGGYVSLKIPLVSKIIRNKELLFRWSELNAFTAIYRTHEGNNPKLSSQIYDDEENLKHFAKFAKVYQLLAGYRKKLFKEAEQFGYPVVRHPILHYPNDKNVSSLKYQFMLGEDFMIAPVLNKGQVESRVYLPKGSWVHIWTKQKFKMSKGRFIKIKSPVGEPPVFYKEGLSIGDAFSSKATLIVNGRND